MDDPVNGLPCLGDFGGPVLPYTALGGFLNKTSNVIGTSPPYQNSEALVITFLVNNYYAIDDVQPAVLWEKALVFDFFC